MFLVSRFDDGYSPPSVIFGKAGETKLKKDFHETVAGVGREEKEKKPLNPSSAMMSKSVEPLTGGTFVPLYSDHLSR